MKTPMEQWEWFGSAAHLCVSDMCRFHLSTRIGNILVSTVGDYYPTEKCENPDTVGCGRLFETMTFEVIGFCECGCGLPKHNGNSLSFRAANSRFEARNNHMAECLSVARS